MAGGVGMCRTALPACESSGSRVAGAARILNIFINISGPGVAHRVSLCVGVRGACHLIQGGRIGQYLSCRLVSRISKLSCLLPTAVITHAIAFGGSPQPCSIGVDRTLPTQLSSPPHTR
eukprot:scaffold223691_cov34-Tisochrysis_lutea.AAC.5